jgi:hypothetical protein
MQKSSNEYRHKDSDSLYAHYSQIDSYDIQKYPDLALANPLHFTIQSGQSLYIPKNWWHWVKTTKRTFAVNFWFNNQVEQNPFVFSHTIVYDLSQLNDERVSVWNSGKNVAADRQTSVYTFSDFYNSGLDDKCVITLRDYSPGKSNRIIKHKLADYICFPSDTRVVPTNSYDYNLWISSNKHDTGLHYDDEDGVLTVVEGEKEVILFPPSDSDYLYPFPVKHKWRKSPPLNFRYNTARNFGNTSGISSAELLDVTCNENKRVLSNISKLYETFSKLSDSTPLVWGFKKGGDDYRWEIYRYTLHKEVRITSWDIHTDQNDILNDNHYYYKFDDEPATLPFWGYGKYKKDNTLLDESKIFVIDSYKSYRNNYDEYMNRLGYKSIKEVFKDTILEKYSCYELCIFNKNPNQIFVMYLGLTNDEFVGFLKENDYPGYIIEFVVNQIKMNRYNINNEIAIVYDIDTQNIVRSGFYGNL